MAEIEDLKWTIKGPDDTARCFMKNDGTVLDKDGKTVLGYINLEGNQAGSANEDFLGEAEEDDDDDAYGTGMSSADKSKFTKFKITGPKDEQLGTVQELDPGFASIKEGAKTLVVISDHGELNSPYNECMGKVEGFSADGRVTFALLFLLIKNWTS